MRFKVLHALAGAIGLAAIASTAPAISYVPPINYNSTCGISTVFAPGSVSVSTVYVTTSLPNSAITLHEILPGTITITVPANSAALSTIYETIPASHSNAPIESQTATVYVTIPASPISSSSTEAIGLTPSTISKTIQSSSTPELSLPPTTTHTSTRHTTLTVLTSSILTETLTSSSVSPATPTSYAAGVGSTVTHPLGSIGSSELSASTGTVYTTAVITISSCPPEVTNCPYATKPIILTSTIPVFPEPSSTNAITAQASTAVESSTIYTTMLITISSCGPDIKDCPFSTKPMTVTSTISLQPATSTADAISVPGTTYKVTSETISTTVITISSCPPEVTECPFTTAPVTHTSTIYATSVVSILYCAPGAQGCPSGGTKGIQPSTTLSIDAVRQSSIATSEAASSNGYISYYVESSTTHWLNGQTPDASQSYVYTTSAVTVVPVYSTYAEITNSTPMLQSTVHLTAGSTEATSAPLGTETSTSTIHSTKLITATATVSVSVGTGSSHASVATGVWNSTSKSESGSSRTSDSPASTSLSTPYPTLNSTSSVGPTGSKSSSSSIDIYKSHLPLTSLSTLEAQSGFLPESTTCTDDIVFPTGAPLGMISSVGATGSVIRSSTSLPATSISDNSPIGTSSPAHNSMPMYYAPYPTLNITSSVGPTGSIPSSTSLLDGSSTSENSPVGTSSSSTESSSTPAYYVPYPTMNMTTSAGYLGSVLSSLSSVATSTSDNSPFGTSSSSSTESSSTPASYVPYPVKNTSSVIGPTASSSTSVIPSTISDNSPIGTSLSSSVSINTTSSVSAGSSAPSSFVTLYSSVSTNSTVSSSIITYGRYSYATSSSSAIALSSTSDSRASSVGGISTSSVKPSSSSSYFPSLTYSSVASSSSPSNFTLSSSTSQVSSIALSTASDNSPVGTSSSASVYSSTPVANHSSTVTSAASASATPTVCGEQGDFTLNFDDIPPLSVSNGTDPNTVDPAPVFNPYHQFDFSDGFTVVPPPTDPYLPESGKLLLEFIPSFNSNGTNPKAGPNTDELGYSGGISDGDHGLTGCFSFNFYGASFGCDSKGPDCDFTFSGYRLNGNGTDVEQVTAQDVVVPACPALSQCSLTPVTVDDTFQDLVSVRINVTVGGVPKIWWMDDLKLGWFNNSCTTGLCRQSAHIH